MNTCTVCGSHNLNAFTHSGSTARHAWWCEDCGSMHTDMGVSCPEKSMLNRQVLAFHKRFGQKIGDKPHVPDEKTMRFRLSLIAEEFFELLEATLDDPTARLDLLHGHVREMINEGALDASLPLLVDALADLAYVIEGAAITFGVNMTPIAEEVHRCNMEKLPSDVAAKDATHRVYEPARPGVPADIVQAVNAAVPIKRPDGKIMKPPNWQPPDIEGELRAQGWEP